MTIKSGLLSLVLGLAWFLASLAPPAHGAATVSTTHATVTCGSSNAKWPPKA